MPDILILTKTDIPEIVAFNEATWAEGHEKAIYRHTAVELEYGFDEEALIAVGSRSVRTAVQKFATEVAG